MEERLQTRSGICPENADYSVTYQLFPDATPALEPEYARVNLVRMGSDLNIEGATEAVEVSDLRPGGSKPFPLRRTLTRQESIADMMGGEREELLTRYRNLCMSKGKTALQEMAGPLLGEGGGTLACPRRSLGDAGVTAMAQFFSYLSNLHTIDLADNAIHDQGATALARALRAVPALRELVLDDNKIGNRGSEAVADTMAARSCKMETFSVARNNLGDPSLAFLLDSLAGKTSIVSIDVSFNSLAQCSCKALAGVLSKCANLRTLDCHWGHMRAHGAVTFAEGLAMSTSLTSLNLAFNGFGDLAPCSALCDALAKDTCAIVSLDLSCNRIGEKAACLIAAKGMNLSLSLERLILDKNPIGRTGCKRIMAASFGPSTASAAQADGDTSGGADGATQPGGGRAMMRARRKSDARGLEECEATVEADAKIEVSLKDCSAQRVNKESFNPVEPGGDYVIDLGDPYWRQVALDMLKLEFSGNGKIERNTVLLDRKFYKLKKIDRSNFDEDILPETGDLSFRFDSLRKPPSSQAKMEDQMHARILALMEVKGSDDGVDLLEVVITGGSIIGIDQATALLTKVKDSERKVRIAHLTFHHLVPQDSAPKILALLSEGEMKMLQKLLGSLSVEFTPNNPTGTHKLNLGVAEERSIGNNLRSWRCAEGTIQEVADKLVAQMLGGRRDFIEKVWRNCTLNGGAWPYRNHVQFPAVGELCFDYTKLSRPQDENREVESISDTRWGFFIEEIEGWEGEEIVKAFRALSNDQVFLCRHVRVVLSRVKPSQVALRVEVCVTAFSRTLDFYGFYGYRGLWQVHLTLRERAMLRVRLGRSNMFSVIMAVDYYELDLADKEQRWIMQQIVRMAVKEPGVNCVNETINGLDASVPNGWSSDVPTKGEFTCFYCREQSTVTAFIAQAKEAHPGSIPDDMEWLVKTEWTDAAKCTRIKNKMQEKFATPEVGFTEMDKDGGGTIDRKELAMGLFQMGIWLHPTELKTLFEHVDADEGGSVDLGEFQDFWAKY